MKYVRVLAHEGNGLISSTGFRHYFVSLFFQHFTEIETDNGFIFCNDYAFRQVIPRKFGAPDPRSAPTNLSEKS